MGRALSFFCSEAQRPSRNVMRSYKAETSATLFPSLPASFALVSLAGTSSNRQGSARPSSSSGSLKSSGLPSFRLPSSVFWFDRSSRVDAAAERSSSTSLLASSRSRSACSSCCRNACVACSRSSQARACSAAYSSWTLRSSRDATSFSAAACATNSFNSLLFCASAASRSPMRSSAPATICSAALLLAWFSTSLAMSSRRIRAISSSRTRSRPSEASRATSSLWARAWRRSSHCADDMANFACKSTTCFRMASCSLRFDASCC
mmetsp:Transcript_57781/g.161212  ORF Transcript_57781/g.161212 Transcript_57781/m.161212 type:complete len:264 (+) Transcript_57781:459-1250(+)